VKQIVSLVLLQNGWYITYDKLNSEGYQHKGVHHTNEVWAIDNAHTNTIEGY
jgi:hypothetical protein